MAVRLRVPGLTKIYVNERKTKLVSVVVLAAVLQVAAGAGMAYVAGFGLMDRVLSAVQWPWLVAVAGALLLALIGNYFASRAIYQVDGGPVLGRRRMLSVVLAGFSGFLAHGGSGLDHYAVKAAGRDDREASARASALAGMEHGVLALFGMGASIAVLAMGLNAPPPDFTIPWAVVPVPGFLAAFWLAGRYRRRLEGQDGWKGKLSVFVESIVMIRCLFSRDIVRRPGVIGMVVFWGAELFAIWAGLAAFGFHMNGAQLIVGAGTGMLFTRRTGPLAGAGILILTLAPSIWYSGAPLAVAVAGVFAYRAIALWLPMPFGMAQIGELRAMVGPGGSGAGGTVPDTNEPALSRPKAS